MATHDRTSEPQRAWRILLDVVIYLAIGLAALAFGAGLHIQSGVGFISSLIASVALFLVMAASQAAFTRVQRHNGLASQIAALEKAVRHFADDIERIDRFAAKCDDFDALSQRMEDVRRIANRAESLDGLAEQAAQVGRIGAEMERLEARFDALRSQFQIEGRERHEQLAGELQMLETLVKQVAEQIATDMEARPLQQASAPAAIASPRAEARAAIAADDVEEAEEVAVPATAPEEAGTDAMLEQIRRSVESNRIELFLQPIMTLPQRRVRYYEALSRLRNDAGEIMLPRDYLHLAETAGIMPVIDNVMLYRSVQVLRRLEQRSNARGVFCNISMHSLVDPEFFPEFLSFMKQNRELAESMSFEFSQGMIDACGPIEQESLASLAALGFRFSLDQVRNLDVDFQALHQKGFRTVKIEADVFLNRMAEAGARIHPADMRSYLDRFGMQLIIEKIEDERMLAGVLEHNVKLAQGFLFSEPRPVRPEVFADSSAAAA